jgi:hypothetical protein
LSIRLLIHYFRHSCDPKMKSMILIKAIKEKSVLAIVLGIVMFLITPVIQSFNSTLAFEIWFRDLYQKPLNSALYILFSILFGIFMSLYFYSRKNCIDCKRKNNAARSGILGSILGFIIGVCPACFSWIGVFVQLSTSIILTTYSPIFTLLSISIILCSIFKLGGFRGHGSNIFRPESDTSLEHMILSFLCRIAI